MVGAELEVAYYLLYFVAGASMNTKIFLTFGPCLTLASFFNKYPDILSARSRQNPAYKYPKVWVFASPAWAFITLKVTHMH